MNWGHKIIIVFIIFAAGILTLVTKSMRTRLDMVTPDYYGEELKYQQVIDGRQNVNGLSGRVVIRQPGNDIEITFPPELHHLALTGRIKFYRPSDAGKDLEVPLQPDENGRQLVSSDLLTKGQYQVKLRWEMDGKPFYQEEILHIN